jgi:pimeloyl-ACP methyl ester carboxylesterase
MSTAGTNETTTVRSEDGTEIAVERSGAGPEVVLVGGILGDRSQQAPVAALLAPRFTVYNYDRRGHGESGFTAPYRADREVEDLAAVIAHAGGSACVYATSGVAVIALQAAAGGVPVSKLALWEPPFIVDDSRPAAPADYRQQLEALLAEDRRGDMVALFLIEAAGIPAAFVEQIRQSPFWGAQEAVAHTLVYDATMMGNFSIPAAAASADVPTVVLDGGTTPWLTGAADAVAAALPDARRRTLAGQQHNVEPDAIAPALAEHFAA